MISFALLCPEHHRFDSWFQSAAAFDALVQARHVVCPVCGSTKIDKALMAPAVRPARTKAASAQIGVPQAGVPQSGVRPSGVTQNGPTLNGPTQTGPTQTGPLQTPANDREAALAALRREVEKNSDYVGLNFAAEARAMHEGDAPARSIYGEARIEDARKLLEDGVPVAPLPFRPMRKVN